MKRGGSWSLVRRLTGGVVLVALLSFAAQGVVLGLWLRPLAAEAAAGAGEQALQVRAALRAVGPAERQALARRLSMPGVTVSRQAPPAPPGPPPPPPDEFGALTQTLHDEGIELRLLPQSKADAALIFRLPVDGEFWWLTRSVPRPRAALGSTLVVWLAVLAVATLGALWASVRMIARPLGRLANQLSAQEGTLRPLSVRDDASTELQALVHAFNELVQQVTAAAQARQQLLAGVSHDLRTPLARLRLRAETQCEPALADALTADLLALERIVSQFLAYVQGDGGADPGRPAPLHETVCGTVQRYVAAGQALQAQVDPVELPVPDVAVQRLLANLIDNALAYGRGPVAVTLRAGSGGAELSVSDAGPGMTGEEFERAQQPFVRLTRTRSELGHCGLGLAIVAQVTRQLGGRLQTLRAADGRFSITLHLPG